MISTLLWFGLIALFFFMMMRGGCGGHVMGHSHHHDNDAGRAPSPPNDPSRQAEDKAVDPVCGMQVTPAAAKTSVYRGQIYYFCSAEHRDTFEANPQAYLDHGQSNVNHEGRQSHGCC